MITQSQLTPTLLPVPNDVYTDSPNEPQYVTSKRPNGGLIHLNSYDSPSEDKTRCIFNMSPSFNGKFNRVRVLGITMIWFVPNVNPRNNTITFHSSVSGNDHTVTLAERYYDPEVPADMTQLATDVVTALNTVAGASLINFNPPVAVTGFPRKFTLTATAPYHFVNTCSALAKGRQMYNFDDSSVDNVSHTLGPINGVYTQYVDVVSTQLTKFAKIRNVATNNLGNLVMRSYVGAANWGLDFHVPSYYLAHNWDSNSPLSTIDIHLFDQNGEMLYTPDNGHNFSWQMALLAEI